MTHVIDVASYFCKNATKLDAIGLHLTKYLIVQVSHMSIIVWMHFNNKLIHNILCIRHTIPLLE